MFINKFNNKKQVFIDGYKTLSRIRKIDAFTLAGTNKNIEKETTRKNILLEEKLQASLTQNLKNLNSIIGAAGFHLVDIDFNLFKGIQDMKIVVAVNNDENKTTTTPTPLVNYKYLKEIQNRKSTSAFEKLLVNEMTILGKHNREFEKEGLRIASAEIKTLPQMKVLVKLEETEKNS